jgi:hypothetical protein
VAVFLIERPTSFAQMFSGSQRPFVTGITPVVGPNGEVGGIFVDPEGVVRRPEVDISGQLGQARRQSGGPVSTVAIYQPSALRKISLRRLERELGRLQQAELSLPAEIEFLAGLQRIEYVFVDPDDKDIILAGPAQGWRAGNHGFVVGEASGLPVIDLCDLLTALRCSPEESVRGIACSMDASPQGLENYARYMQRVDPTLNQQTLREMGAAIGNYDVTFTGVASHSHFARILITADLMMKRLAMNLEPSPVRGVTSYLHLLQKSSMGIAPNMSPRWWLASDYDSLLRDKDGLAWNIQGSGVTTMSAEDFLTRSGERVRSGKTNPLAQRWADNFTRHYPELSVKLPVFGQLRNCMDLAIVAALLHKYELPEKAGFQSSFLMDAGRIQLAEYPVPRFTPPQVSYMPSRSGWIVTVSGGVVIDGWAIASITELDANLEAVRHQALNSPGESWWWD